MWKILWILHGCNPKNPYVFMAIRGSHQVIIQYLWWEVPGGTTWIPRLESRFLAWGHHLEKYDAMYWKTYRHNIQIN